MIHTSKTPRYLHPIRVMTARLADELIRTFGKAREILEQKSLPFLKPVGNEIIYSDTSALFSTQGRGDSELYRQLGYTGQYASEFARGLTYPEETSVEREVRLRGAPAAEARGAAVAAELPADWAEKLEVREAAGIDARSQLVQAIVDITGKPKEELDKERGKPFTGSLDDWAWFATTHRIHVITTREGKGRVMIANLLPAPSSAAAPRFVILSPDGLPYVSKTSGRAKLTDGELPVQMLTFAKGKGIA